MMDATPSPSGSSAPYPHAVKFYNDEGVVRPNGAEFLAPGLGEHSPAIVIATPAHRR